MLKRFALSLLGFFFLGLILAAPSHASENPVVTWSSTNNATLTGVISLKATATPASSGTATIAKWCLTINGKAAANNAATFADENSDINDNYLGFSNGCWSVRSDGIDLREITLDYDTTSMENKAYVMVLTVTDSSGRVSTPASLTFTTANPGPELRTNSTIISTRGYTVIDVVANTKPDFNVAQWCIVGSDPALPLTIAFADSSGTEVDSTGITQSGDCLNTDLENLQIQISTATTKNGTYKVTVTAINLYGQPSKQIVFSITLNDPGLLVGLPSAAKIIAPTGLPSLQVSDQGGKRTVASTAWFIDGKQIIAENLAQESLLADKSSLANGTHTVKVSVVDSAGIIYEVERTYLVDWPKMVLALTGASTIDPTAQSINITSVSNPGNRSIVSIDWKVDGKAVTSYSEGSLVVDYKNLLGGTRKVTATVKDNYDDVYVLEKSYQVKWSPSLKIVGLDGYFYYSPAAPKITVKAYLGGGLWTGSHPASASYKNASGKLVKQNFTITGGTGSIVLQTLKVTTNIKIEIASSTANNAASVTGVITLQKKPPAPVYTNITLTSPQLVIWPNSFNIKVSLTGKGAYSCNVRFQDYSADFTVNAGSSAVVKIQPTLGVNMAQSIYGYCTGTGNAGTTRFNDWIILSLQR